MEQITASHGSGGTETANLIERVFAKHFSNPVLNQMEDSAVLDFNGQLALTTDSFVVDPIFFAGGDIGRLAVCGTVNDLLTAGAKPLYLTAGFILEEGLPLDELERIVSSMAGTAGEAGVAIVAGDTKVIGNSGSNKGNGGLYINTAGVGKVRKAAVRAHGIKPGDTLIVTGLLGEHHACILSHRLGIENEIKSDVAPLVGIVSSLIDADIELHTMRDITRGGLATVLNELMHASSCKAVIEEEALPVSAPVRGFAGLLGLEPLYMGNEGKMVIAVPSEQAEAALAVIKSAAYGADAAVIGHCMEGNGVELVTALGGRRAVMPLAGEGLPRIC